MTTKKKSTLTEENAALMTRQEQQEPQIVSPTLIIKVENGQITCQANVPSYVWKGMLVEAMGQLLPHS